MYRRFERILNAPIARAFISHSSKDDKHAMNIRQALKRINIPCFLDETDLGWGSKIVDEINIELHQCSHLLVVLSPSSLTSQWVHFEVGQAAALSKEILPFLTTSDLQVPDYLRLYKPVTTNEAVVRFFQRYSKLVGR